MANTANIGRCWCGTWIEEGEEVFLEDGTPIIAGEGEEGEGYLCSQACVHGVACENAEAQYENEVECRLFLDQERY